MYCPPPSTASLTPGPPLAQLPTPETGCHGGNTSFTRRERTYQVIVSKSQGGLGPTGQSGNSRRLPRGDAWLGGAEGPVGNDGSTDSADLRTVLDCASSFNLDEKDRFARSFSRRVVELEMDPRYEVRSRDQVADEFWALKALFPALTMRVERARCLRPEWTEIVCVLSDGSRDALHPLRMTFAVAAGHIALVRHEPSPV